MMEQQLASWAEWKEKCALNLCGPAARKELPSYAWSKGCEWSAKSGVNIRMLVGDRPLDVPEERARGEETVWAYFENRALAGTHRSGKTYKDWIFSHADDQEGDSHRLAAVLAGVKLQMQMVIRNVFADEISLAHEREKHRRDQSVGGEGEDDAANDWLDQCASRADNLLAPSLLRAVKPEERADLEQAAERLAQNWLEQASHREKLVMWVSLKGGTLSNPKVEEAAGVKKSQLSACLAKVRDALGKTLRATKLPCQEWIGGAMLDRLYQALAVWAESEKLAEPGLFEEED